MKHNRRRLGFWGESLIALCAWVYTAAFLFVTERGRHVVGTYWQVGPNGLLEWTAYLASFAGYWMAMLLYVLLAITPFGLVAFANTERDGETVEWTNPGVGVALLVLVFGGIWLSRTIIPIYD